MGDFLTGTVFDGNHVPRSYAEMRYDPLSDGYTYLDGYQDHIQGVGAGQCAIADKYADGGLSWEQARQHATKRYGENYWQLDPEAQRLARQAWVDTQGRHAPDGIPKQRGIEGMLGGPHGRAPHYKIRPGLAPLKPLTPHVFKAEMALDSRGYRKLISDRMRRTEVLPHGDRSRMPHYRADTDGGFFPIGLVKMIGDKFSKKPAVDRINKRPDRPDIDQKVRRAEQLKKQQDLLNTVASLFTHRR